MAWRSLAGEVDAIHPWPRRSQLGGPAGRKRCGLGRRRRLVERRLEEPEPRKHRLGARSRRKQQMEERKHGERGGSVGRLDPCGDGGGEHSDAAGAWEQCGATHGSVLQPGGGGSSGERPNRPPTTRPGRQCGRQAGWSRHCPSGASGCCNGASGGDVAACGDRPDDTRHCAAEGPAGGRGHTRSERTGRGFPSICTPTGRGSKG